MTAPLPVLLPPTRPARPADLATWPRPRAWHGAALLALLVISAGAAQAAGGAEKASVLAILIKWSPLLLGGFVFNLAISLMSMALGSVAGFGLGVMLMSPLAPLRQLAWWLTQFFRNAPWLVLLFFAMFLLPFEFTLGGWVVPFPDWVKAVIGFALAVMANVAEIVRGAIQSIPSGQWEAAESLGFTRAQTLLRVILPQCVKRMLPPWMNLYSLITMSTVLASVVGVTEMLTLVSQVHAAEGGRPELLAPLYAYAMLWFFLYCYPIGRLTVALERRFQVKL